MQILENPKTAPVTELAPTTAIPRRKTRPVKVGAVTIGGNNPVVVQSMINEDTLDVDGSVAAITRLHQIGCEIVQGHRSQHGSRQSPRPKSSNS